MKRFLFVAFLATVLAACGGNDEKPEARLELAGGGTSQEQTFYKDEVEETGGFAFYAPAPWTAEVNYSTASRADGDGWLRLKLNGVEATSGPAGNMTLTIEMDANDTDVTRSAEIVIDCGGSKITVKVTQDARTIEEAKEDGDYEERPDEPVKPKPGDVTEYSVEVIDGTARVGGRIVAVAQEGDVVTLTPTIPNGQVLVRWRVLAGEVDVVNDKFTMPARNVRVQAVFGYSVTVSSADEEMGSVSTTGGKYVDGETFEVTATPNANHVFTGWEKMGDVALSGPLDNPVTVTVNGGGTVIATFTEDPTSPYLLYWDGTRMQVGAWGVVTQENILFTKFGSAVAFTMTSDKDTWDAGDVKFNPTGASYADYTAIPCWNGDGGGGDGYISSAAYHTLENVKAGRGDICKLAGLTKADIDAGVYDNGKFRLPTLAENEAAGYDTFVGTRGTVGYGVQVGENSTTFLPAAGGRDTDGATYNVYSVGYYWSSRPSNTTNGSGLSFYMGVHPSSYTDARNGFSVRCVPQ